MAQRTLVGSLQGREQYLVVFRARIASGQTVSDVQELYGRDIVAIRALAPGLPAGTLRIQFEGEDGTLLTATDAAGAVITHAIGATTARHFPVSPLTYPCCHRIAVQLSAAATADCYIEIWARRDGGGGR